MHEMALCEYVLQVLEEESGRQGYVRVERVRLEVGALSCVEKEALRFSFEAVARGSLAEGARLELRDAPGQGWCGMCEETVTLRSLADPCPRCGGFELTLTRGLGLRIKDLDVV
ncbi:hydrogenase nickel incorporation protein HypA [Thiohalorhabdus denitrificans]|uniref:Hydrogenase maturation factor HypA n=1 Tax=Thiohalorhabdus denitrificans TaxID=381306 RepID=A0A0P9ENB0_9GAMM|nr:hydrogenase maturation nickel metallochaperone HypA [Thiohalorhabdus denitrificans]KPV39999.1 hydrogenase nickel incorporation protein HypA [Thiohalorhabdus denitrificans]SCY11595.1 Hydrogenase-3 nickel incorporation protein HypA [Thiohalorhabdus denitrificans]